MVLVTGGTGFLGAYIIQELVQKGHAVRAICRSDARPFFIPSPILEKVEWVPGDVLDVVSLQDAMEGIDSVVHAAAKVSFHAEDSTLLHQINHEGTANMINMAIEKKVRRFIYVSSVASLGRTGNSTTVDETRKWEDSRHNTTYAISKYQAEMEVWRGMGEGLEVAVLNPSTILGYGDWHSSSCALFHNAYTEFPWYTTGLNGFVGVEDAARATVLLLESTISNQRFILNSENWTFQHLFNTIADSFGKKRPWRKATRFLGAIAWRVEWIKSLFSSRRPLLTRNSARVAQSKTAFSNRKILDALPGFHFTPLQQVVEQACQKYLEHPQTV